MARHKTVEQEEAEYGDALDALDMAYEAYFASCKSVRQCPYCDGGWEIIKQYSELYGKEIEKARECDCFIEHLKVFRAMKHAQKVYRKRTGNEPPEYDRARADLFEYAGDERLRPIET
jgi:CDGSH-type Zn-finger protein